MFGAAPLAPPPGAAILNWVCIYKIKEKEIISKRPVLSVMVQRMVVKLKYLVETMPLLLN